MKKSPVTLALSLAVFCLLAAAPPKSIAGEDWKPIDPAQLALKAAMVEKDADAEALFWEVKLLDELEGATPRTVLKHYVRIKVFTERGRETQSKIDIPYLSNWRVQDIAARTIKPDGTIVELKKSDVLERTIEKANGVKVKAKSFAMPGVEPGAVIEYRWKEVRNDRLANYVRLYFQREVPVHLVKYYLKPLSFPGWPYGMRAQTFNGSTTPFVKEKDGFYSVTMSNVPAFREEPRMPPEDSVRPWMLVYYSEETNLQGEQFWNSFGKKIYDQYKSKMKPNEEVKQAVTTIIGDASTPEAKLERLFEYCRAKIKNINDDVSGMTPEQREKFKENKSPSDTLKRGMGTSQDIDLLFASMAIAAGFDARVVNLADRSDVFLDRSFADDYFMQTYDIAVKVGEQWRFYDPASPYVTHGMLRWQEEGQEALLSDPKQPSWIKTPLSPPTASKVKRTAQLTLNDDGTLEGDARIEYYGHMGAERKEWDDDDSPTQREETLRESVKSHMSTAELSNIRIENITDPIKPFVYEYHIRIPGYAQRTGKRLFVEPAFFQHGVGPLFSASSRKFDVYFHYPWSEEDEVFIKLPPGYALDNADAPSPFDSSGISGYKPTLASVDGGKALLFKREFYFGGKNSIIFPVASYDRLKTYFDVLHKSDTHTITLKQSATTASSQ